MTVGVLLSMALGAPAASAAVTGISGTVTSSASGNPIEFAEACAYQASNGFYAGCGYTEGSGHYTISSLQPGSYKVRFSSASGDFAPQYYDGRATRSAADAVQVTANSVTPSVDAALVAGAHIGGTVTVSGGAALEGAEVCANEIGGEGFERCETSGPSGEYLIRGLPAGSYRISFTAGEAEPEPGVSSSRNYVSQFWHGKASEAEAEPVSVGAGGTVSGIYAVMQEGGTIAGTVTDAVSHSGLEFAEVCASESGSNEPSHCEETGQGGHYVIAGLPTGSYKVHFAPAFNDHTHAAQYYSGKSTAATADPVSVVQGARVSGVSAALLELGKISGHVTATGGGSLTGTSVCADPVIFENGSNHCEAIGAGGAYTISGVPAGEYRIYFNGGLDHLSQYYDDQASSSKADKITVSDAATTSGIDAELAPAGRISGQVTDAVTHAGVSDLRVCASSATSQTYSGDLCGYTETNGNYTIGGLPSDSYRVHFESGYGEISPGHYGPLNYLPQFYNGREGEGEADPVSVTAGSTTGSINAALRHGAEVTGTVTAATGHAPLEGVQVCANGGGGGTCTSTGSDGTYLLASLPSGEYRIRFTAPTNQNYVRQFYDGKTTSGTADRVTATAGHLTTGIDAQLQTGGEIRGSITDASSHAGVEGARVCAIGYETPCAISDASGAYAIKGLPTGSYKVRFDPYEAAGYLQQYYHGKASVTEAEAVGVTAGSPTVGINAAMVAGGTIAGTVTDATSGHGASSVEVCAFESGSHESSGQCTESAEDGTYAIHGVRTGSYRVRFSPAGEFFEGGAQPNDNYITQYYDGKTQAGEATPVTVTDGATTSGVDAAMHEGGRISGRVTAAAGGAPIYQAEVCIYEEAAVEEELRDCAWTDEAGEYTLEGLPTDSYVVVFYPGFSLYGERNVLYQFYSGKSSAATADRVSVTAGSTHQHVDAALAAGGQITGRVTDASTSAPIAGASACAIEAGGVGEIVSCGTTNGLGNYTISGLSTGSYKVEFTDLRYEYIEGEEEQAAPEEIYAPQYWSNSTSVGSAQAVAVTAGSATAGINGSLARSGGGVPGQHLLSVGFAGSGSGAVTSSPAGISCSSSCAHGFAAGTVVTLTPAPLAGSTFSGWSGACAGTGTCQVKLEADVSVVATFAADSTAGDGGGGGSNGGGGGSNGGGSGSPGGGAGPSGGSPSGPSTGAAGATTSGTASTPPLRCKKGFVKKKVKGKVQCERQPKRHRHSKGRAGH